MSKKKKFNITSEELSIKVQEYLDKGGKIKKYECTVPENANSIKREKEEFIVDVTNYS